MKKIKKPLDDERLEIDNEDELETLERLEIILGVFILILTLYIFVSEII